ncbi:hypothetical protein SK854_40190 [Lentzea sp. BCCO 10_0061]|uniref:SpoVT-AbrB domain-containing protein n=1 Tax=Lentzea sokolovensis TaxID=3095429 RepID=A0ABU4V9B9_9PSEU|nr:hypothetical protein [Lentzea sp. BCCO 10_0061]MDX8148391.1 hypothetical protein [Lentzea sp. BCCO 10_0061]
MNLVEALAERLAADPAGRVMRSPRIAGLPVARPPEQVQRSSSRYAFTTIDSRGRLGDRSLVHLLNWPPGTSLKPTLLDDQVIVLGRSPGTATVTKLGHVRLPAAIRHRCQLRAGDGLLLTTSTACGLLVVCTASVLDEALAVFVRGESS